MIATTTLDRMQSSSFLELLEEARAGSPIALDTLFDRFYPTVQGMVHRSLARDLRSSRPWLTVRFSTGDVVQEVFRSVLKDIGAFAGTNEKAFAGYLAMVVRNRILDAVRFHEAERRDGRRTDLPEETWGLFPDDADPANAAVDADELRRLHEALREFPEREQLLLRARFEDVESFKSLANLLGYSSESAARRAFYAAQARLTILLGER